MRHRAKVDTNQGAIVAALRSCSWTVVSLADVGCGVPDLLVGAAGRNILLEVKSQRGLLNAAQRDWHDGWRGQVMVVRDIDTAVAAVRQVIREGSSMASEPEQLNDSGRVVTKA